MSSSVGVSGNTYFESAWKHHPGHAGVVAGYLPQDAGAIGVWLSDTRAAALAAPPKPYQPSVRALADLIERDGIVRMYVTEMIEQVPVAHRKIQNVGELLNTGEYGWLSPSAHAYNKLEEFVIPDRNAPHWGFTSFNAYFHREVKSEQRPVAAPHDPKVIVSANDGTVFQIARSVKKSDAFWLKSQPYSLSDVLDRSPLLEHFIGGDLLQAFLSGANYHRRHAPVAGVVREARVVNGLMFSELHALGFDSRAGMLSQGYEASVNTRAVVIIDSEDPAIGLVAVVPVGITEISSIRIGVEVGQRVEKGAELGYFSYGGSTLCVLFQRNAIKRFTVEAPVGHTPGSTVQVNGHIATAN